MNQMIFAVIIVLVLLNIAYATQPREPEHVNYLTAASLIPSEQVADIRDLDPVIRLATAEDAFDETDVYYQLALQDDKSHGDSLQAALESSIEEPTNGTSDEMTVTNGIKSRVFKAPSLAVQVTQTEGYS